MKTSFTAIASLLLGASMVAASLEPRATMAPLHNRRDHSSSSDHSSSHHHHHHSHSSSGKDDGIFDLSAILANPSSYLASASKAFKNPKYASEFAKETANPSFQKSLSRELVAQFGSKTASIALQQYTAVLNKIDKPSTDTAAAGAAVATTALPTTTAGLVNSISNAGNAVLATMSSSAATSSVTVQILGSQNSGSTFSFVSITILGSAISLGAVVVLAAL